jgi:hypothetical protein
MTQGNEEQWRTIVGAEAYAVSDHGRVKRVAAGKSTASGRVLSQKSRLNDGYVPVVLSLGQRGKFRQTLVHTLVAEAFHGPKPTPGHCVAHNDGNPANNRADNLRWATHAENMHDMSFHIHGTSTHGSKALGAVLTEEKVELLRRAKREKPYGGVAALSRLWNVNLKTASDAASGKTWKHMEMSK